MTHLIQANIDHFAGLFLELSKQLMPDWQNMKKSVYFQLVIAFSEYGVYLSPIFIFTDTCTIGQELRKF